MSEPRVGKHGRAVRRVPDAEPMHWVALRQQIAFEFLREAGLRTLMTRNDDPVITAQEIASFNAPNINYPRVSRTVDLTWRVCHRINGPQAKARKAPFLATAVRHNRLFDSIKDERINIPVKVRRRCRRPRQSLHDLEAAALAPCMLHGTVCSIRQSARVVEMPVLAPAIVWH